MIKNFQCKECNEVFSVSANEIKFGVCPSCGTDDIDHSKESENLLCGLEAKTELDL